MCAQVPSGGSMPTALRAIVLRRGDDRARHDPVGDALLPVVDVVDEAVQRDHALAQPRLDAQPFTARDRARDDVERPGAVDRAVLLVVDREGDAHRLDRELGGLLPDRDLVVTETGQATQQRPAGVARVAAGADQFVVKPGGGIGVPVGAHRGILKPPPK
jgi:hypothetical protein